jgi:hypothetical protein
MKVLTLLLVVLVVLHLRRYERTLFMLKLLLRTYDGLKFMYLAYAFVVICR